MMTLVISDTYIDVWQRAAPRSSRRCGVSARIRGNAAIITMR